MDHISHIHITIYWINRRYQIYFQTSVVFSKELNAAEFVNDAQNSVIALLHNDQPSFLEEIQTWDSTLLPQFYFAYSNQKHTYKTQRRWKQIRATFELIRAGTGAIGRNNKTAQEYSSRMCFVNCLTDLAGFSIHVPTAEQFLHYPHVLLRFHSCECSKHDGGIASLVLMIYVTDICRGMT